MLQLRHPGKQEKRKRNPLIALRQDFYHDLGQGRCGLANIHLHETILTDRLAHDGSINGSIFILTVHDVSYYSPIGMEHDNFAFFKRMVVVHQSCLQHNQKA